MIPTLGIGNAPALIGEVATLANNSFAALTSLTPVEAAVALASFVYTVGAVLVVRSLRGRFETHVPITPPAAEGPRFKRAA